MDGGVRKIKKKIDDEKGKFRSWRTGLERNTPTAVAKMNT